MNEFLELEKKNLSGREKRIILLADKILNSWEGDERSCNSQLGLKPKVRSITELKFQQRSCKQVFPVAKDSPPIKCIESTVLRHFSKRTTSSLNGKIWKGALRGCQTLVT